MTCSHPTILVYSSLERARISAGLSRARIAADFSLSLSRSQVVRTDAFDLICSSEPRRRILSSLRAFLHSFPEHLERDR